MCIRDSSKDKAFKYARIAKFIVGWGSHLYYWVYPGVMVATTGVFVGYIVGFFFPTFISGANPGPVFMGLVAVLFSFFVAWIAAKGAGASTAVNLAINVVQISALVVFSVLALGYRSTHPEGATGPTAFQYDSTTLSTYTYQFAMAKDGTTILRDKDQNPLPLLDSAGKPVPFVISYQQTLSLIHIWPEAVNRKDNLRIRSLRANRDRRPEDGILARVVNVLRQQHHQQLPIAVDHHL